MENELFNNLLQRSAAEERKEPPAQSWQYIADALHQKRRRRMLWLFLLPMMALLLGGAAYWLIQTSATKTKNPSNNYANHIVKKENPTNANTGNDAIEPATVNTAVNPSMINTETNSRKEVLVKNNNTINANSTDALLMSSYNSISTGIHKTDAITKIEKNSTKNNIVAVLPQIKKDKYIVEENDKTTVGKTKTKKRKEATAKIIKIERIEEKNTEITGQSIIPEPDMEVSAETNETASQPISRDSAVTKTNTDSVYTKTAVDIKEENKLIKLPVTKNKKAWQLYGALSYGRLFVRERNIFEFSNKKESYFQSFISVNGLATFVPYFPQYEAGKDIALSLLLKKDNGSKKISPQFGLQLQYRSFKAIVYQADRSVSILPRNDALTIDTFSFVNSLYSSNASSFSLNRVSIPSRSLHLGISAGADFSLIKFNKNNTLHWQVQLMPSINLSQSIQWFHSASGRYFLDKQLNKNFNLAIATALLWEHKVKDRKIFIGPYFSGNMFSLNKKLTTLSNIYTSSVGLQMQIALKNK
jgi:hypothetical protein